MILFELSNIPTSFQSYINKILTEKLDIFVIVYPDAIFIYIKDQAEDYWEAMWWVLNYLRKNVLFANLKKYQFHKDKVYFLGYIILA